MHLFSGCCIRHSGFGSGCQVAEVQTDSFIWYQDLKQQSIGDLSIAVAQANHVLEDQSQVSAGRYGTLIGVYDGHGGPEASRFITHRLLPKVESFARELGGMSSKVLKEAFSATEEEFLGLADRSWRAKPQIASVGSCCLVGVICENNLYVANLGDSRVVLGTTKAGRISALRLSEEHNAGNAEVREELQAQHHDDPHIVVLKHGVWRVKGIIQVSRSIGDLYLKKPEFSKDPLFPTIGVTLSLKKPVLSAEPSVHERTLAHGDKFLIFASDGLWEQMTDQEAVDIVHRSSGSCVAKKLVKVALQRAAKKREMRYADLKKIEPGIRRYFHDDITVIIVYLGQNSKGSLPNKIYQGLPHGTNDSSLEIFSSNDFGVENKK